MAQAGGYLTEASKSSTRLCEFCALDDTNVFFEPAQYRVRESLEDFGIMWVYIGVNVGLALGLYWLVRVPKRGNVSKKKGKGSKGLSFVRVGWHRVSLRVFRNCVL